MVSINMHSLHSTLRERIRGETGEALPDLSGFSSPKCIGKNKDGDRPLRANHRKVSAKHFTRIQGMDAMLEMLFEPLPIRAARVVAEGLG